MSEKYDLHPKVVNLLNGYQSHGLLRYTATKREAVRGLKAGRQAKQGGFMKGLPDFIIWLKGGKTVFIELKSKDGRLAEEQEKWRDWLLEADFAWFEARTLTEVQNIVRASITIVES